LKLCEGTSSVETSAFAVDSFSLMAMIADSDPVFCLLYEFAFSYCHQSFFTLFSPTVVWILDDRQWAVILSLKDETN
jgi:hypothetical protein